MTDKWNPGPSMEQGFWSIVAQSGKVVALRVPDERTARQICNEHNHLREALEKAIRWAEFTDEQIDELMRDLRREL